ncbi:hypothetical protein [Halopiger djelfimassiliensis]|uniref:hypothetical protein n=1 Tax=Halopiger djelfimassiliensis TaxID=1293047 RepID=UPI0006781C97|nr:hypothetical protein [Halopiger djelfimassiliensis]
MYAPKPPQSTPLVGRKSVLETAVVSLATTGLLFTATLAGLVAASTVGDEPAIAFPVSLVVGLLTLGVGVVGTRRFYRRIATHVDRRRRAVGPDRRQASPG